MFSIQNVETAVIPGFYPIEQLPEGLAVLLHVGDRYFYGYCIGKQIHHRGPNLDEPYTGILSPYEFRRLTEYEKNRLKRTAPSARTLKAVHR